ncbi:hypothetical protein KC353_g11767 [Hortaea werneckii]|nr:hypothetical protein KC353_g11767 [Hortaea werneckii]
MLNHLDGLDDIRKNKIKEFSDAAEVKAKWKPKAAPPPKAAAAPAGKKPAPGGKRPAAPGLKKPAAPAKAASPPPAEDPGELKPRATSRPGAKPGGIKPPGSGLKGPSGLAKPGSGLKAPSAGTASPKRQGVVMDEAPPAVPKPAGLGGAGRGLAGRPLGKPAAAAAPPSPSRNVSSSEDQPPSQPASSSSGLSSIERQELHDLRTEVDLLRNQTSDLRQDKMKLTSQLAELQVQNAQLIEDHTRDVLQIKAKETQLTRARSDAEAADERAGSLGREVERMKREMSRLGRNNGAGGAMSPPLEVPAGFGSFPNHGTPGGGSGGGGADDRGSLGGGNGIRPAYGSSRSYNLPASSASRHSSFGLGGSGSADGPAADADADGEAGKENIPSAADDGAPPPKGFNLASPRQQYASSRPISNGGYSSGRATPLSASAEAGGGRGSGEGGRPSGSLDRGAGAGGSASGGSGGSQSEGVESWRRAAEVTQNLKARIEMMKARQNLSRGQ